jgi:hypothetical protein
VYDLGLKFENNIEISAPATNSSIDNKSILLIFSSKNLYDNRYVKIIVQQLVEDSNI